MPIHDPAVLEQLRQAVTARRYQTGRASLGSIANESFLASSPKGAGHQTNDLSGFRSDLLLQAAGNYVTAGSRGRSNSACSSSAYRWSTIFPSSGKMYERLCRDSLTANCGALHPDMISCEELVSLTYDLEEESATELSTIAPLLGNNTSGTESEEDEEGRARKEAEGRRAGRKGIKADGRVLRGEGEGIEGQKRVGVGKRTRVETTERTGGRKDGKRDTVGRDGINGSKEGDAGVGRVGIDVCAHCPKSAAVLLQVPAARSASMPEIERPMTQSGVSGKRSVCASSWRMPGLTVATVPENEELVQPRMKTCIQQLELKDKSNMMEPNSTALR